MPESTQPESAVPIRRRTHGIHIQPQLFGSIEAGTERRNINEHIGIFTGSPQSGFIGTAFYIGKTAACQRAEGVSAGSAEVQSQTEERVYAGSCRTHHLFGRGVAEAVELTEVTGETDFQIAFALEFKCAAECRVRCPQNRRRRNIDELLLNIRFYRAALSGADSSFAEHFKTALRGGSLERGFAFDCRQYYIDCRVRRNRLSCCKAESVPTQNLAGLIYCLNNVIVGGGAAWQCNDLPAAGQIAAPDGNIALQYLQSDSCISRHTGFAGCYHQLALLRLDSESHFAGNSFHRSVFYCNNAFAFGHREQHKTRYGAKERFKRRIFAVDLRGNSFAAFGDHYQNFCTPVAGRNFDRRFVIIHGAGELDTHGIGNPQLIAHIIHAVNQCRSLSNHPELQFVGGEIELHFKPLGHRSGAQVNMPGNKVAVPTVFAIIAFPLGFAAVGVFRQRVTHGNTPVVNR